MLYNHHGPEKKGKNSKAWKESNVPEVETKKLELKERLRVDK